MQNCASGLEALWGLCCGIRLCLPWGDVGEAPQAALGAWVGFDQVKRKPGDSRGPGKNPICQNWGKEHLIQKEKRWESLLRIHFSDPPIQSPQTFHPKSEPNLSMLHPFRHPDQQTQESTDFAHTVSCTEPVLFCHLRPKSCAPHLLPRSSAENLSPLRTPQNFRFIYDTFSLQ